ncbi:hypothetical protein A3B57_02430 [Microgenomates group bacterium RIFCSPLOWO2_01_FULL_47_10]|nr:MAG: hypothetical protein A3B57_02430 [Microgenomates group bacterium RIFCSPLOWO2_01_FULL_47_10]
MKSKKTPFFSIVIPTLNEEKYLPILLKDLTAQTNSDFEIIVVDGHSADKTVSKAKTFSSKLNLTVVNHSVRNVCVQRNSGAAQAKAFWLLFLDADNRLPPYFIQGLRYQIDKSHPEIFTTFVSFDSHHPLDKTLSQIINAFFLTQQKVAYPSIFESCLGITNANFKKISGFDPTRKWSEGRDLLHRLYTHNIMLKVFKEPIYTGSLRRLRKEGSLKLIRNFAPLILADITGTKLDPAVYQKFYPMLGGGAFKKPSKPSTQLEKIIIDLIKKYRVLETIEKLNQPIIIPKNPFAKLFGKLNRH